MQPNLQAHEFYLSDTARRSQFLMPEELEGLAAELVLDSGVAFGKLQGNVTSQLKVPFAREDRVEQLPITVIRNLCSIPIRRYVPAVRGRDQGLGVDSHDGRRLP